MDKVFVQITAEHNVSGDTRQSKIRWEDGRVYNVDRALAVCKAPSLKGSGLGIWDMWQ